MRDPAISWPYARRPAIRTKTSLNYSWSASEGAVDGTGPEVRWNSSDRRPGTVHDQSARGQRPKRHGGLLGKYSR